MKAAKGKLMIVGGSELSGKNYRIIDSIRKDFIELEILKRIIDEIGRSTRKIEVITTASEEFAEDLGKSYREALHKLGYRHIGIVDIREREEAFEQKYVDRIQQASAAIFTGGDQIRLSTILGGTPVLDTMFDRYHNENFLIAGTSAGAMVMSNAMIYEGHSEESFYKGGLKITSGFGLLPGVVIDTHFVRRGRFGRLAQAIAVNPGYIGIGLMEDTAALVSKGDHLEVVGSGNVMIIDGHMIKGTNYIDVEEGSALSIENLLVHILARGDKFSISERRFLSKASTEKELNHKS